MTVHYNDTPTATIAVAGTQILMHIKKSIIGYPMFTNPANPGVFAADENIGQIEIDEHELIAQIFLKIEAHIERKKLANPNQTP